MYTGLSIYIRISTYTELHITGVVIWGFGI